jgi:hypothetical protein
MDGGVHVHCRALSPFGLFSVHWYGGANVDAFKQAMQNIYELYGSRGTTFDYKTAPADLGAETLPKTNGRKQISSVLEAKLFPGSRRQHVDFWVCLVFLRNIVSGRTSSACSTSKVPPPVVALREHTSQQSAGDQTITA